MVSDAPGAREGDQLRTLEGYAFCTLCGAPTALREAAGRLRPVCTSCGHTTFLDPKLAVAVIIVRDGLILLGRRGPGTRQAGLWSFPAGFVERGEQVEHAAAREAREETGLDITIGRLVGLFSSAGETVVLAVYAAAELTGEALAGDDLTELGWFPIDKLPQLAFARDYDILSAWSQETAAR